jgi:hypothetical protein
MILSPLIPVFPNQPEFYIAISLFFQKKNIFQAWWRQTWNPSFLGNGGRRITVLSQTEQKSSRQYIKNNLKAKELVTIVQVVEHLVL